MSGVQAGQHLKLNDLRFEGLSLSGIRTALSMPDLGISFDVAQGFPFTLRMKKFFITHGHLDHAAGIPYLISQKAMRSEAAPIFYVPPSMIEPISEIMRLWEKIEQHEYHSDFRPVTPESFIDLNPQAYVRPFRTIHRIESLGYTVFARNKKLKPEFSELGPDAIRDLRQQGIEVQDKIETPLVTFTGDTQIEFLDQAPWIRDSKILFCEATYLDSQKTVEHARQWGHTHLDELISELDQIRAEKIVLIHSSSRYSDKEAARIVSERIPEKHRDRVMLFPGR